MSLKSHAVAFRAALLSGSCRPVIAFNTVWTPSVSNQPDKGRRFKALSNSGYLAIQCRTDSSWYGDNENSLREDTIWLMRNNEIIGRINQDGLFARNGNTRHPAYRALVDAYKAYRQATLPLAKVALSHS